MKEAVAYYILQLLEDIATLPSTLILLAVLLVMTAIVLDSIGGYASKKRQSTGVSDSATTIGVDGTKSLPLRTYVSDMQGLAGRPDALISENGYIIPIERKPLANKIRDRYVAQILVYMRLIEEFEGKKPPYGYLILGPHCRRVKIQNTEARQAWLQNLILEMQGILKGAKAIATPHPIKCKKCDVKDHCSFKILPASGDSKRSKSALLAKRAG